MAVSKKPLTAGAKAQFFNQEKGRFEKVLVKSIGDDGTILIQKRDRTGRPNGKAFVVPAMLVARAKGDLIPITKEILLQVKEAATQKMEALAREMQAARKETRLARSAQKMLARLTK